jgi:ABC-2 type transport system permease protein
MPLDPMEPLSRLRAWLFLLRYSFDRQLRSRKTPVSAAVLFLVVLAVWAIGAFERPWEPERFLETVVLGMLGFFVVPAVSLVFGTGAIGGARDDRTLVYLLTRPLGRWSLFAGAYLGAAPLAVAFSVGGLWAACAAAWATGEPALAGAFRTYAPVVAFAALAYTSFFHLLSAVFRHASLIGVAYVFFVEVFLSQVPGILKRISVSFYTWCLFYATAERSGIPLELPKVFLPVSEEAAVRALLGLTAVSLVLGGVIFAWKEHSDVG